ncbi:MAG: hypothetical protein ACREXX_06515, partial [Gammaproteobacteria bacterium]
MLEIDFTITLDYGEDGPAKARHRPPLSDPVRPGASATRGSTSYSTIRCLLQLLVAHLRARV